MPTDVKMPQMGESIYEGTITKWLKKEGEFVKKDDPLYELRRKMGEPIVFPWQKPRRGKKTPATP